MYSIFYLPSHSRWTLFNYTNSNNVGGPVGVVYIQVLRDVRGEKQKRTRARMQRRVNSEPDSLVRKTKNT